MSKNAIKTSADRSSRKTIAMHQLCCQIVKLRKLRKLSQKDLADRLGLKTAAQLCKLEKGDHLPHAKFLERIEVAMNLPPLSLVNIRNQIALDACHDDNEAFDDPSVRFVPAGDPPSIPEKEMNALLAKVAPLADEYADVLRKLNLSTACKVNLGNLPTSSSEDGIDYAEGFRDIIGDFTAPLSALLPRLQQLNFRFFVMPKLPPCLAEGLPPKPRHALGLWDRRYDNPVILVNGESAPHSQLYEIAYMIGAYFRYRRLQSAPSRRAREEFWFCRAFATTLLVPTVVIRDIIDDLYVPKDKWTLRLLDNIALRFNISSLAMLYRIQSIGRITDQRFVTIKKQLRRPGTCDDKELFPDRPPLVFGNWLETLKLRAAISG